MRLSVEARVMVGRLSWRILATKSNAKQDVVGGRREEGGGKESGTCCFYVASVKSESNLRTAKGSPPER